MRTAPLLLALAAALATGPGALPAAAQDAPPKGEPALGDGEAPKPLTPEEEKAARELFAKAKGLVEKGHGIAARKLFEQFLDDYPGAPEEMILEADDRCGDNFLAGIELQHEGGPSARRIDVELMGDGYTREIFRRFKGDALSQMKEFWAEPLYAEYAAYFNVWRFDLVSKEDGVDDLSPEERGMPPPEDPDKRRRWEKLQKRLKERMKQYSTALDCKKAGPQDQVWANPDQVYRWRRYLPESDGLTIAFANKGSLGMGGGGIATTGKKVAVVHEFGHAFVNLLDEYAVNPMRPDHRVFAANAISTEAEDPRTPPPMDEIPWKHWLLARVPGVGVHLGGATFQTGVFRPAPSCAMNSGGSAAMCPVCREAGVLRIYSYLSPIDESGPAADVVPMAPGDAKEFFVVPLQPKRHALKVDWTIQVLATGPAAAPPEGDPVPPSEGPSYVPDDRAGGMWQRDGARASERRRNPLPEGNPSGAPLKAVVKKQAGGSIRSTARVEKLPPGVYRVTARVVDDTRIPGEAFPWVLKDPDRLREERRAWTLQVTGPSASVPVPTPGPSGDPPPGK